MKPLPPTLRENRRYVLVKMTGEYPAAPAQKEIYRAVADAVVALFGDVGAAEMHVAVIWSEGDHAIVRCTRGYEQQLIAALAVVTRLCGAPAVFRSVAVSGTVLGAKKHLLTTTWDTDSLPGYRCSGKKVDSLAGNNTHRYLTRDDIHKE